MSTQVAVALIGGLGTILVGWLVYRGGVRTASASKDAALQVSHVDAQQSALDAWEALLGPYRQEVVALRRDLKAERDARTAKERQDAEERAAEKKLVTARITRLTERVDLQAEQIKHWKRLARTIARFAAQMRDEVLRLGGTVPATPEELLLIQSIEDDED